MSFIWSPRFKRSRVTSNTYYVHRLGLFVVSHLAWGRFFLQDPRCAHVSVEWVLGFMLVMLWIVPFAFFISLAANESILPGGAGPYQGYVRHGKSSFATLLLWGI
jgi:hypothetical protein